MANSFVSSPLAGLEPLVASVYAAFAEEAHQAWVVHILHDVAAYVAEQSEPQKEMPQGVQRNETLVLASIPAVFALPNDAQNQ